MDLRVEAGEGGFVLAGSHGDVALVNRFLAHLVARNFAVATVRAYAYDLLNLLRFLTERELHVAGMVPADVFDYVDWQRQPISGAGRTVVRLGSRRGAAPATVNRRIAAARGLFDFAVLEGLRADSPIPAARRAVSPRAKRRGLLGHIPSTRPRTGGRLVRQPRRLPDALDDEEIAAFFADLDTYRDRAIVLGMLLGGLRAGEVRSLRLADVDQGRRRLRIVGKGDRERVVPVDAAFFVELGAYLRKERPAGCPTAECFVVLRGPTTGQAMTEAGLRRIFRTHQTRSGATRVRPHRLRHTYGTQLAAAGIDLLVLARAHGACQPGDDRRLRAPVDRRPGRRVRPSAKAAGMTALPTTAGQVPHDRPEELVARYEAFVRELGCGEQAKRLRCRAAQTFLAAHPDLEAWMGRATPARLTDIRRTSAWPFLSWCFAEGVVVPDVDLLGAKARGEFRVVGERPPRPGCARPPRRRRPWLG